MATVDVPRSSELRGGEAPAAAPPAGADAHMKGLDVSRAYFEAHGLPMLREQFPDLLPYVAAGLFGSGSECFGFDDDTSRDHDFDPGFVLLLPDENVVDRTRAFKLERAYAALPREFMGLVRPKMAPVGGPRRGVMRASWFFAEKTGSAHGELTNLQWLVVPQHALAEAVNGEVFHDGSGELERVRARLARYPEDVRRKKLAGNLLLAAQAGQYNYLRCLRHGETGAAQLAAIAFVEAAMQVVFLLNNVYEPFYKWRFRALRALPTLALEAELFEYLVTTHNDGALARDKHEVMEGIADDLACELRSQGLVQQPGAELEKLAYELNDGIGDAELRNLHILAGV